MCLPRGRYRIAYNRTLAGCLPAELLRIHLLETVWKIAEGFLAVRFWRQEAADLVLFASVGGLRSPELGLIPIFQTVSLETVWKVPIGLDLEYSE